MILSMTGYAATCCENAPFRVDLRMRAVNGKYLDLVIRLAPAYQALEERIRRRVSAELVRGRIELRFQIATEGVDEQCYQTHLQRMDQYVKALRRLQQRYGLAQAVSLETLLQAGAIEPMETSPDLDCLWESMEDCLARGLEELNVMRVREGTYIASDFENRLQLIESHLAAVATLNEDLLPRYRERLTERLKKLTDGVIALDGDRILQEAALLADRTDISEEVVRTGSHIQQFRSYMQAPEPCGRKLNFLLQELNREANTMGSKLDDAQGAHHIVEIKTEIEKIREQVQNVL